MITRRDLNTGLLWTALAAGLSGTARARPVCAPDLHLNRLTFGATPEARRTFERAGLHDWLDDQLAMAPDDPALDERLSEASLWIEYDGGRDGDGAEWEGRAEARPLGYLNAGPAAVAHLLDWGRAMAYPERTRPGDEVAVAAMVRAVHARAQLREVMTQFWHDHFSVDIGKDHVVAATFPQHDRLLRVHAFGNFRALLGGVARSPAMLRYLDNDRSRASPANENFARELLELHTLGADSYRPGRADGAEAEVYTDGDVYEVARAFTGWSIGYAGPEAGGFAYVAAWHDPYQKRVLGRALPSHAAPMADGETVLDMLAAHPGTARHVTAKILRRLGIEEPSETYRDRVAGAFQRAARAPDQIARTIRAIVHDPDFAATPPLKLRRPFEFAAACLRAMGAEVRPTHATANWYLARSGWTQHRARPPTGHPDRTGDWATTQALSGLVNVALNIGQDWMNLAAAPPTHGQGGTMAAAARHWERRFGLPGGALDAAVAALGAAPQDALPDDGDGRVWVNAGLAAAAALTPGTLLR